MRKFMKQTNSKQVELTTDELIENFKTKKSKVKVVSFCAVALLAGLLIISFSSINKLKTAGIDNEGGFTFVTAPVAATSSKKDVITIPSGIVKANPFLPYRNIDGVNGNEDSLVNDVPRIDLIAPPDFTEEGSDAAKMLDTTVSGILFDKFSPSAILNVDGNDYLVKKGDVVHNYKIVSIAQDSVTIQNGKNTFKAGIGELLTDGSVNYNDVSNLDKKFGGEKR